MKSKIVLAAVERIFDAGGIDDLVGGLAPEAGALYALLLECARGENGRCFDALSRVAARRRVTADYLVDRANVLVASAESRLAGDLYRILGVPPLAADEEIRARWREVVKECHPDRMGSGAIERFRELRGAYEVLADPRRRADYERVWGATLEHIERARVVAQNVELENPEEFGQRASRTIRVLAARVGGFLRGFEPEPEGATGPPAGEISEPGGLYEDESPVLRPSAADWRVAAQSGGGADGGDRARATGDRRPEMAAGTGGGNIPGGEAPTAGGPRASDHDRTVRPTYPREPTAFSMDPRDDDRVRLDAAPLRAGVTASGPAGVRSTAAASADTRDEINQTYPQPGHRVRTPGRLQEDKMHDVLRRTDAMLDTVRGIDQRLSGAGFDGVSAVARLFEQIHTAMDAIPLDDIDSTLADIDRAKQALDAIGRDLARLRRLKLVIDHTGPGR